MAVIQSLIESFPPYFFKIFSSCFFCSESVCLYLSNSILIMFPKLQYSLNSPKIPTKSSLWCSMSSRNPSIPPNFPHHPLFSMIAKTLQRIFLMLLPPPVFDGRHPSQTVIITVLVWSRRIYMSLTGAIYSLTSATVLFTSPAIVCQVLSMS